MLLHPPPSHSWIPAEKPRPRDYNNQSQRATEVRGTAPLPQDHCTYTIVGVNDVLAHKDLVCNEGRVAGRRRNVLQLETPINEHILVFGAARWARRRRARGGRHSEMTGELWWSAYVGQVKTIFSGIAPVLNVPCTHVFVAGECELAHLKDLQCVAEGLRRDTVAGAVLPSCGRPRAPKCARPRMLSPSADMARVAHAAIDAYRGPPAPPKRSARTCGR